jgi:hypothetical protein
MKKCVLFALIVCVVGCRGRKVEHSVPSLMKTLKTHKDPKMRYWAAESLGHFGPEAREAVPALSEALKDPDGMVRMGAAYALAEIGPDAREAAPKLQEALQDPDKQVRDAAAYALPRVSPS